MLVPTLLTLSLLAEPQTPKPAKSAKAPKAAKVAPAPPPAEPTGLLRQAECVLALKGRLLREAVVKFNPVDPATGKRTGLVTREDMAKQAAGGSPGARATAKVQPKTILEEFDYEIPGTLQEEAGPNGSVRFTFVPVPSLRDSAARGVLHLEDSHPTYGAPPVVVDATEIRGVANFQFTAAGRGQGIVPASGDINMMGQVRGATMLARPGTTGEGVRPVLSTPLPVLATTGGKIAPPALRFEGISLWAWANTKGPFTAQAVADYKERNAERSVTGQVTVTFRVSAAK